MWRALGTLNAPLLGLGESFLSGSRPPQPVTLPKGAALGESGGFGQDGVGLAMRYVSLEILPAIIAMALGDC